MDISKKHQNTNKMHNLGPKTKSKKQVPEIVQVGHPALHKPAKEVPVEEIGTAKINDVIEQMILALESQRDGVGIAAPQIGVSLQIFIVAGFVYDRIKIADIKKKYSNMIGVLSSEEIKEKIKAEVKLLKKNPHHIFINPVITKESKEKKWMDGEGCLSVRWLYGKVYRSTKVSIKAYDEKGKQTERGASGFLAHIFQHEVDHLAGILFIDKAKDLEEFDPEDIKKEQKKKDKNDEL